MATMLYRKQHAEIDFAGSILTTILTWVTRSVKIGPERLRTVNCRLFWTKTIPNRKKCLQIAEQLDVSQAAISMWIHAIEKRSENGCRMNWTIGRWSDAKTHTKFCLPDKKESRSCIGLWQAMKSGSIFRILNTRNLDPAQPSTSSSRPNRFGRKTMLYVWWDQEGIIYYELLNLVKLLMLTNLLPTTDQIAPCSAWKKATLSEKTWQADFPPRQRIIAHVNNGPKLLFHLLNLREPGYFYFHTDALRFRVISIYTLKKGRSPLCLCNN